MDVENSHIRKSDKEEPFFHSQLLICQSLKYPFHLDGKEIRVTIVEFWQELARLKIHKDLTTYYKNKNQNLANKTVNGVSESFFNNIN